MHLYGVDYDERSYLKVPEYDVCMGLAGPMSCRITLGFLCISGARLSHSWLETECGLRTWQTFLSRNGGC